MQTDKRNELMVEMTVDYSTLYALLDDVADYVNGLPNEKLKGFIGDAFYLTNDPGKGARNPTCCIYKPEARYLELLPLLKAGDISFDSLCNTLSAERGAEIT